jgi:dissimilatory sulfite reductase (desulfoviridin) alpha/beta subunit
MRSKMPWIDRDKCDVAQVGENCKAALHCPHGAFQVMNGGKDSREAYRIALDLEKCRLCGECSHACDRFAVKMI